MKYSTLRFAPLLLVCVELVAQQPRQYTPTQIPTRDGKLLAADVYANDSLVPKPVVLIQTPYNKNFYRLRINIPPQAGGAPFPYDSVQYNYVTLDWRGFYGSKDAAVQGYDRGLDGYDAVEWIARQPWCNGKVGTWGPSALGAIQFMTARRQPPHLVCCVPLVKDFKTKYTDYYYGGVFRKEQTESLQGLGFTTTDLILAQPYYSAIWRAVENNSDYAEDIKVPMLVIGGWFDHYPDDVLRAFEDICTRSAAAVRGAHKLIFGPWVHSGFNRENQGELTFPGAGDIADAEARRFFDRYLLGLPNGYDAAPVVRYYQMGANEWRSTAGWKSVAKDSAILFLQPGEGLDARIPATAEAFTELAFDPRDPSPSYGAARFNPFDPSILDGPLDIRAVVENRSDALLFTTEALQQEIAIDGPVTVRLFVSSDKTDSDISVRFCDVYPDGRSMIMTDGIRRLRLRNTYERDELLTPGQIYPVTVELQNLALTILKGHRIRIVVSSSDYPRFDINLNNGSAMYAAGDTLIAHNRIYHDAVHPSRVVLTTSDTPSGIGSPDRATDLSLSLYPQPSRALCTASFTLPTRGRVFLHLTDILGRTVRTVEDADYDSGRHSTQVNTSGLPAGTYLLGMRTSTEEIRRPLQIVR